VPETFDEVYVQFLNGFGNSEEWKISQSEAFDEKHLEVRRFLRDKKISKPGVYLNGIQIEISNAQMVPVELLCNGNNTLLTMGIVYQLISE